MAEYLDKATQCEILNGDNSVSNSEKDIPIISDDNRRLSSLLNMFGIKCIREIPNQSLPERVSPAPVQKSPPYPLSLKPTLPEQEHINRVTRDTTDSESSNTNKSPQSSHRLRGRVAPIYSNSPTPIVSPSLRSTIHYFDPSYNLWDKEPDTPPELSEIYRHPWL